MKKYTLDLREIRVVPVEIEAESLAEAIDKARQGDGQYLEDAAYPCSLSFDDLCDNLFETGYEDGEEIEFNKLNEN